MMLSKTNERKRAYVQTALLGMLRDERLSGAALVFYHAEVPIETARGYLETISRKLNPLNPRAPV
jgi:hypothetical protein